MTQVEEFTCMRIVVDEYGIEFLGIESEEGIKGFRKDMLRRAREKANASKQGRGTPTS